MSWLTFLFHASYVISTVVGVTVLYQLIPAYRRTKKRAVLYIVWAYLFGVFATLCQHTIGRWRMPHSEFIPYKTLEYLTYFTSIILGAIGIIKLTRAYLVAVENPEKAASDDLTSRSS